MQNEAKDYIVRYMKNQYKKFVIVSHQLVALRKRLPSLKRKLDKHLSIRKYDLTLKR